MRARLARLCVVALLAPLCVAAPATAAPPQTFSGPAGSWTYVTVARPAAFDRDDNPVLSVRGAGEFAGVVLQGGAAGWVTYVVGQTNAPCAFATPSTPCPVANFPSIIGERSLRPGRYRLALLGAPGATVTVRLRGGTVTGGPVRWRGRGTVTLGERATSAPVEYAANRAESVFRPSHATVVGAIVRVDLENTFEVRAGFCARSGGDVPTVRGDVVCSGRDLASQDYVYSTGKGTCAGCFPAAPAVTVTYSMAAVMTGDAPELTADGEAVAGRSRVTITPFALRLS
ncbi:MAG TPA: hypothetical protein VF519_02115 [Mycobacteriales bacterium]